MNSSLISIIATAALGGIAASTILAVAAADEMIDWIYDTPRGGQKIRVRQCESVSFKWDDGIPHDIVQFQGREQYESCDFDDGVELAGYTDIGIYVLMTSDLRPGVRYYGCSIWRHCINGGMKVAVKVIPDLVETIDGHACKGRGKFVAAKTKAVCERKCMKSRRGCGGYQFKENVFRSSQKKCKLFKNVPTRGKEDKGATCVVARSSCV